MEFKDEINRKEQYLSLLSYKVPLIILNKPSKPKVCMCYIESNKLISSLGYIITKPGKLLPPSVTDTEGILIYSPYAFNLEPGQQMLINIHLTFEVPNKIYYFCHLLTITQFMSLSSALALLIKEP